MSEYQIDNYLTENARSQLQSELAQVKSTSSNEASETTALKSRVASLEASNRDTLAVLESKSSAYDKLAEDLATQHQKAVDLRRHVGTLEQNLQTANSAASTAKFKEQSLSQEIEMLKRNNEWLDNELKTKTSEYSKFRKEKNARTAELQRQHELTISENDNLKRTEATLKSRLEDQAQKVEEHLATIQKLEEEAIRSAEGFRLELESASRLAELQKQRAESANTRVHELSTSLEEIRDEASDEIGRLRAEIETEQQEKDAAEARVTELESSIQDLQSELAGVKTNETFSRSVNGNGATTPVRPGTPSGIGSPLSVSRLKGGLSTTQLYSEYKRVERQLADAERTNEQLSATLEEVTQDLQSSGPEIEQLRNDHGRLEAEMVEMSSLMDAASKERDDAVKEARKARGELESLTREGEVYRQQLRDLSSEIKVLLMEQHLRENGQNLSAEEITDLKTAAMLSASELEGMNDTARIISEHLTTFKDISELQGNNVKLLRMIRELGDRMENEEAQEREQVRQKEHEELEQLRVKVATYKDELQAMVTQSKSYIKERDMFRSMLTRRGQLQSTIEATDFARSMPLPPGGTETPPQRFGQSLYGGPPTDEVDYAKLLKELQIHFDTYKQEAATDHTALKNQVSDLSKRNSDLQMDASRTSSQLGAAIQRGEMLQGNFDMLRAENNELQKRVYSLMENSTKQEMKAQQIAEELVEAHGVLDSFRRETANLKAEKDLWKNVEKRLLDDNESLRNERSRLDKLNGSLQNMLNEREQADAEVRRRLQSNVESLESELQSTKRKLNDELEDSRKATLRREYEQEQSHKRIDDLVSSLGSVREELSAAKTSKDHLQARVDEMTVELRSAEERLQVLQSKPTATETSTSNESAQDSVTREQELAVEVSELKRDLELKSVELDRANEQVEDYKSIAQAAEERLQELTDTNDQYREETERLLEEKSRKVQDLEQRIADIGSELSTTNGEMSKLRDEHSESGRRLEEQKAAFEAEIARLKDEDERHATAAHFHQEDLKAQAEIAQRAQQSYETELLKHAEAAKSLQIIRGEANHLKLELVEAKGQAESAQADLAQKEESWSEQKDRYEREVSDLRKRREEVLQQNNILHQQLEGVTNQISALQRDRAALAEGESENPTASSEFTDLQEVIKYLRREKEIVDVQYHLSTQESKRLRQQLDHTQTQLDETRLKLDQQLRTYADAERNTISHNKLMETLNELNLFRESSVTLRAQYKEAETNLAERNKRVEELSAEIEPLKIRVAELESSLENHAEDLKLTHEDRDRWQQRTQNILQKYDRVDPEELEAQKQKLATLEKERDEAVNEKQQLQRQVDTIPEQVEAAKTDLRSRLTEQFKTRDKQLRTRIQEKQVEVDSANTERTNLETQLQSLREELDSANVAVASAQAQASEATTNGVQADTPATSEQTARIEELTAKVVEQDSTIAEKSSQLESLKKEYSERQKAWTNELNEALNKKASELRSEHETALSNALKELETRLQTSHERELQAARTTSQPPVSTPQQAPKAEATPQSPSAATELPVLTESQARLLVQKNETVRNILRINIQKAVAKAKEEAKVQLDNAATAGQSAIAAASSEEIEKKHTAEKEALSKELETKHSIDKEASLKELEGRFSDERLAFSKEAEKKIQDQVAMAEKRSAVKLNMAQNQAKLALHRLDIVKRAAQDTPERPVKQVWDEAAVSKPQPVAAPAPNPATATSTPTKPNSHTAPPPASDQVVQPQTPAVAATTTPLAPMQESIAPADGNVVQAEGAAPAASVENGTNSTSNLPRPASAQSHHVGTGPAALRGIQSALPRGNRGARGGPGGLQSSRYASNPQMPTQATQHPADTSFGASTQSQQQQQQQQQPAGRGSGIPRGGIRGRGGLGRAGAQVAPPSNLPQPGQQTAGAAGLAAPNLNPNAKQFNPQGNKRARDESEGGGDGLAGKRIRGGGAGAGT